MDKIIYLKKFLKNIFIFIILSVGLYGCNKNETILIEKPTKVLENPYPENYPSTNPKPNSVLSILEKGETVKLLQEKYGKDYLVYKVQFDKGKTGYIIYEKDAFKIL